MHSQDLIILFIVLNFRQINILGSSSIGPIIYLCTLVHILSCKTHIFTNTFIVLFQFLPICWKSYKLHFFNNLFLNVSLSSATEVRSSLWSLELPILMRSGWGLQRYLYIYMYKMRPVMKQVKRPCEILKV